MDNLTGNAASWTESGRAAAKSAKKQEVAVIEERADVNVSNEIIDLRKIKESLEAKYKVTPRKQIYDVITLVSQSILSLTDVD